MKIAIYETVHLDWVLPLCELFTDRPEKIYFFTNVAFKSDIKDILKERFHLYEWYFIDPEMPKTTYLKHVIYFFSSTTFECIILNSVDSRHLLIRTALIFQPKSKILINVHDVNNLFRPNYKFSLKVIIRSVGKELLRKRANAFIVNATSMKEYIISNNLTEKPIYWLPPVIAQAKYLNLDSQDELTFTIPGSIDEKRRDYITILNTIKRLLESFPGTFKVILAGRPVGTYGEFILYNFEKLKIKGLKYYYSLIEINEITYRELISQSTVLISPLREITSIHDKIDEKYGKTKVSGNVYDAIRHGKPLIIPDFVNLPEEINSSCCKYASEDELFTILSRFIRDREFTNSVSKEAVHNSKKFSRIEVIKKLLIIIKAIRSSQL